MNTKQKLNIGDKVKVLVSKSKYGAKLDKNKIYIVDSFCKEDSEVNIKNKGITYILCLSDVKLITGISKSPRQFRLLKDTPNAKKGEIFIYSKILKSYRCQYSNKIEFSIEHVENQPDWFEEIFKENVKDKEIDKKIKLPSTKSYGWTNSDSFVKWAEKITDTVNSLSKEK